MTIQDAIKILETHNKWRRGAEIEMVDPKELGEAIDLVIEHIRNPYGLSEESKKAINNLPNHYKS